MTGPDLLLQLFLQVLYSNIASTMLLSFHPESSQRHPFYETGSRLQCDNYRPILLLGLCNISKVKEESLISLDIWRAISLLSWKFCCLSVDGSSLFYQIIFRKWISPRHLITRGMRVSFSN